MTGGFPGDPVIYFLRELRQSFAKVYHCGFVMPFKFSLSMEWRKSWRYHIYNVQLLKSQRCKSVLKTKSKHRIRDESRLY